MVNEISPGVYEGESGAYFLQGGDTLVTFTGETTPIGGLCTPMARITSTSDKVKKYAKWGTRNDEPDVRENLIADNNILPELLRAKVYMLLGSGLMLYKERVITDGKGGSKVVREEIEKTEEVEAFLEKFDIMQFRHDAAVDLIFHAQFFDELTCNAGGELVEAQQHRARYVRAAEISESEETKRQRINHFLVSGNWKKANAKRTAVRAYQGLAKTGSKARKFIRRYGDSLLGGPYYYTPTWWGSRKWVQLANCIPEFHLANIQNGYTIRFHVQFPKDYFVDKNVKPGILTDDDKKKIITDAQKKKKAFMEKMNAYLAGLKNTGRAIFTTYDVQKAIGNTFPGVIITPISADLKDEAMLKLFDKSNQALVSGQGILPSVSGVETPGKLSSGSDIRNALAFYLIAKTPEPRRIIHEAVDFRAKLAGILPKTKFEIGGQPAGEPHPLWGAKFGARDMIITTTDKNPSGTEAADDKKKENEATV